MRMFFACGFRLALLYKGVVAVGNRVVLFDGSGSFLFLLLLISSKLIR